MLWYPIFPTQVNANENAEDEKNECPVSCDVSSYIHDTPQPIHLPSFFSQGNLKFLFTGGVAIVAAVALEVDYKAVPEFG